MRKSIIPISVFAISLLTLTACGGGNTNKKAEGEAIVMGDPSTIVTETDSAHLRDIVADLKPAEIAKDTAAPLAKVDSAAKQPDGTEAKPEEPVQKAPTVKGLNIDFKEVDIVIPNLTAKQAGKGDLQKTNSATFQLSSGELNNNSLQFSDATITSVQMRYQSGVNIKNNLGTLELDALNSTSGWKPLKGARNVYTISGLEDKNLATARVNASTVRNAINKEARQRRMNKKTQQQWLNSVKNVRAANQKPMDVVLRAVMFKIDGKDKAGKSFSKQVRIDL
jgi:hypothetical protein